MLLQVCTVVAVILVINVQSVPEIPLQLIFWFFEETGDCCRKMIYSNEEVF